LALYRGDAKGAAESLQACLRELYAARYELLTTPFSMSLIEAFGASARFTEAIALVDETEKRIEANGDLSYMPELLRVKGNLLGSMPQPALQEAEICFAQSLEWSRRQGALGWELRSAVDLAALWSRQGQSERAKSLLAAGVRAIRRGPGYRGFEGSPTPAGDAGLAGMSPAFHARCTKLSTTFFSPAFSNAMVSLLPSIFTTWP
jgi:hypothetical protein